MNVSIRIVLLLVSFMAIPFLVGCSEEHQIRFETNGGSEIESIEIEAGKTVGEPEAPFKEGHAFLGWYRDSALETEYDFSEPVDEDLELHAKWDIATYSITYELDGGVNGSNPTTYTMESETITLTGPSSEARTFEGWYANPEFTGSPVTEIASGTSGDIALYAKWADEQHTIAFNSNGGSPVDAITQDPATAVSEPDEPTREGYAFGGWYQDVSLDTAYTFTTMPAEDVTLHAKWDIATYSITYELDGGINGSNPTTYTMEDDTIILAEATKGDHTFEGWYGTPDFAGGPLEQIAPGTSGDITLHAKWSVDQYTMTYHTFANHDPLDEIVLETGETVTAIAMGGFHSSAATSDGRVFTWGNNSSGRLGDGTTTHRDVPTEITAQLGLAAGETVAGISLGAYHSSALTTDGRVFTWGSNYYGQLGNNTTTNSDTPVEITGRFNLGEGETVTRIASGKNHSAAITSEGRLFTWGENWEGQLGDGTTTDRLTPTEITGRFTLAAEETITAVALGYYHSAAITSEGRLFTWGENWEGQLGDGTTTDRPTPTEITDRFALASGETLSTVALGYYHSAAITTEGRLFTWGENLEGQLGESTTTGRLAPTEITDRFALDEEETLTRIALGAYHTSALTSEGRLFAWGDNDDGQLGDGTYASANTPEEITDQFSLGVGETLAEIRLGYFHSSALTSEGRVFTWGANTDGRLGNGTTDNQSDPQSVLGTAFYSIGTSAHDYGADLDAPSPRRDGYAVDRWYTDRALNEPYAFTTMPAEDLELYAAWDLVTYTITYDLGGGWNGANPATYTIETETITLAEATREGHTFEGWYDTPEFSGVPTTQIPSGTFGDLTLHAKWATS